MTPSCTRTPSMLVSQLSTGERTGSARPGEERVARADLAGGHERVERLRAGVERDDRADRRAPPGLDGSRVPTHDDVPGRHGVALRGDEREALAVQLHGVDAEVDEHCGPGCGTAARDDEGMRVHLHE